VSSTAVELPPRNGSFSINRVRAPPRAAAMAAGDPADPDPTTTTSKSPW
jgi:hypothetical protein